jgi:hypothetical protein
MTDVSAAIIVLAGAVFVLAGALPSPMTEASRQRLIGIGYLMVVFGMFAWLLAFVVTITRVPRSL